MRRSALLVVVVLAVVAGYGASAAGTQTPQPAGAKPSKIATMVCQKEAAEKLEKLWAKQPSSPTKPG